MTLPPDPDEPTRRLPPTQPAEPIREREVVTAAEPDPLYLELLDRLRSLRAAVMLLGVLAVAALGVALWALLTQEEERDARRGATPGQVQELRERVDALESDLRDAPSNDALERLRDEQEQLAERLRAVREETGGSASSSAVEDLRQDVGQVGDSVEQLGTAVDDLQERVDELERQQADDGASP